MRIDTSTHESGGIRPALQLNPRNIQHGAGSRGTVTFRDADCGCPRRASHWRFRSPTGTDRTQARPARAL